ncbi:MAG TPA: ATP-binding protein [Gaiellaceae bacterium]|nr:ATP-binding protein [Gaiellaceae bacterium]
MRLNRRHSNRGCEQWGEILGDATVAAALIDRLVHHATTITLKGKSYRLRERGTGIAPALRLVATRLRLAGGASLHSEAVAHSSMPETGARFGAA